MKEKRVVPVPQPRAYTVKLPNGNLQLVRATFGTDKVALATVLNEKKISCAFTFGTQAVERKVKMYGKVLRGKNGNPLIVSVDLPGTLAVCTIDGKKFTARSVCKPPDKFDRQVGIKFALRWLLKLDAVKALLKGDEFESLTKICLTKPPKLSQIKRVAKLVTAKRQQVTTDYVQGKAAKAAFPGRSL